MLWSQLQFGCWKYYENVKLSYPLQYCHFFTAYIRHVNIPLVSATFSVDPYFEIHHVVAAEKDV